MSSEQEKNRNFLRVDLLCQTEAYPLFHGFFKQASEEFYPEELTFDEEFVNWARGLEETKRRKLVDEIVEWHIG